MELRRWIQILCILPALQDFLDLRAYASMECPDTHYPILQGSNQRCCKKCEAGEKVERHCLVGQSNSTVCKPCEDGTYQASPNDKMRCRPCQKQIKSNRKVLQECTKLHDMEYGDCNEGYYHNTLLDYCSNCIKCGIGYGVKRECTNISNTECDYETCSTEFGKCLKSYTCPNLSREQLRKIHHQVFGTFSDQESFTQKCMPCTPCKDGEEMYNGCTSSSNYECKPKIITTTTITTTRKIKITMEKILITGSTPKPPGDNGPTDGGRKENSSWVMPFFIASMALLLFLFLAFVIGVTVWCHIQTRNRQNVIIQAEDPQVVQRLTKSFDDPEPICLPSEESRYRYHEVPEQKPGQLQENGMMLRDVSHDIIEDLANFLNPMSPPSNWRKVASMLDFPWSVINNLALCPTSATQQLLERWGTKRGSTVYKLYLTLKDIGRDDAAEVLERLLVQPAPSCPRSM